jgi:hypothetical protein
MYSSLCISIRRETVRRHWPAGRRGLRERLDERREIGPRLGDPALREQRQIGLGHIVDREFFARHESQRCRFRPLHDTSHIPLRAILRPSEERADVALA